MGGLLNHLRVRSAFKRDARKLIDPIVAFARAQGVDRVWITLSTQALMAIGSELASRLGLPLLSVVWDPPEYLARHLGWDSASIRWTRGNFDRALRASERAMVVSQNMVDSYGGQFGLPCVIVRHALDAATIGTDQDAGTQPETRPLRIGFAGTLYEPSQLDALVAALNLVDWKLGERPVSLRIIGNRYRFNGLTQPARVELLGWRGTEETRAQLAECEVTYLPIPFTAHFREFAKFSFPTKLSTYLAAGRPVLVHGPEYSESTGFCRAQGFGVACTSEGPEALLAALRSLCDPAASDGYAGAVRATLERHFSRPVMRRQFATFIGVDEARLQ
jgi:hypothetical protein